MSEAIVPVKLDNDSIVYAQVTVHDPPGSVLPQRTDDYRLKQAAPVVEQVSKQLLGVLDNWQAQKATVEFALELGVEAGKLTALIAKGTAKASLKVSLTWENPRG